MLKRKKPVVLIVEEAHELHHYTLTGLKRLTEMIEDGCRAAFDTATLALRAIPLHITRDEKPEQMVSLIRSLYSCRPLYFQLELSFPSVQLFQLGILPLNTISDGFVAPLSAISRVKCNRVFR